MVSYKGWGKEVSLPWRFGKVSSAATILTGRLGHVDALGFVEQRA